jgi:hypothetical protein
MAFRAQGRPFDAAGEGAVITIPVSAGELIDKITILALKAERVRDARKRQAAERELSALEKAARVLRARDKRGEIAALGLRLGEINGALWDVEDRLRAMEHAGNFGPVFVEAARSVYRLNDQRARLKNEVNSAAGSPYIEVKDHPDY